MYCVVFYLKCLFLYIGDIFFIDKVCKIMIKIKNVVSCIVVFVIVFVVYIVFVISILIVEIVNISNISIN